MDTTSERALQSFPGMQFSLPDSPNYQAVTNFWAYATSKPKVVIHCVTSADVQAGIKLARESGPAGIGASRRP